MTIQTLSAATPEGRQAIETVMAASYCADIDEVPPEWALARVVDGVPVAFILIDPHRQMAFPGGDLRYAFICDVATREDRRREGYFRALVEETFARLREAGIPLVLTHGRYPLYRRFGFDVFTHHSGIFITPEQIARTLGTEEPQEADERLVIQEGRAFLEDRLLVTEVRAETLAECRDALLAAAAIARGQEKNLILFEHPPAPSYGSAYPLYPTLETPLTALARACGAQVIIQGADPESGTIPDADWIEVLDAAGFLHAAVACLKPELSLPEATLSFETDAGNVTLESTETLVRIADTLTPNVPFIRWPSAALAQLVTGYRDAAALAVIHNVQIPADALALLDALFPSVWRLSRNESWTYKV
ncbi:MAG: GNAT family N-acetyltransferase [Anaerolineae bacterium]|nr:GNAT family N-acetyltransferase [Anaerolineae bacterium]